MTSSAPPPSRPTSAADLLGPTPRPTVDADRDGRPPARGRGSLGRPAPATPCLSDDEIRGVAAWLANNLTAAELRVALRGLHTSGAPDAR